MAAVAPALTAGVGMATPLTPTPTSLMVSIAAVSHSAIEKLSLPVYTTDRYVGMFLWFFGDLAIFLAFPLWIECKSNGRGLDSLLGTSMKSEEVRLLFGDWLVEAAGYCSAITSGISAGGLDIDA